MKKWEYDFKKLNIASLINMTILNEMGSEGWELVSFATLPGSNVYYFKREKIEEVLPDHGD